MQSHMAVLDLSLLQTLIPLCAVILAGILAITKKPQGIMMNVIRVCAGGILFSGIVVNLFPNLELSNYSLSISIAILCALVLMWALNKLNPGCCAHEQAQGSGLTAFVIAFGIEFFVNGMLIAFATMAGHLASLMVAISLGICCFSCGLAVAGRLIIAQWGNIRAMVMMVGMSLLFPIGACVGVVAMSHLPTMWLDDIMAFAIGVLLYICVVDLIVPGFNKSNYSLKVVFFVGFVIVCLLKGYS